ncbi:MAG TPA: hypothetical protein VHG93_28985 [Longimicrobium sp.]|nr:hypothetical protein [Longimicrobium sp.]
MHDLRPRPDEYRNVCGALLQAFGEMYAEPRRARRAFAAALEARGRVAALLTLRTVPERFGALRPDVEPRVRDFADEAAESYALCREHCTRPLVRDGARLLRIVQADRSREQRLTEAKVRASQAKYKAEGATVLHDRAEEARVRMMALARRVYAQPERAVEAVLRLGRERGKLAMFEVVGTDWKPAGRLRRTVRKDWLGWLLGATDTTEAEGAFLSFRVAAGDYLTRSDEAPTPASVKAARAAREAADAEVAAIEAESPPPVHDPARTLRQAAQPLYEAMRLLERRPSDAAPHLTRQLAPLLPEDAAPLIAEALRLAAQYDEGSDRKRGGGYGDRWRGPARPHRDR